MSKSYQASIPTRRWNCLKLCAVSSIECMKAWWQVPRKAAPQPCKTLRDQHVLHFASKLLVKKHVATTVEGDSNAGLLTSMVLFIHVEFSVPHANVMMLYDHVNDSVELPCQQKPWSASHDQQRQIVQLWNDMILVRLLHHWKGFALLRQEHKMLVHSYDPLNGTPAKEEQERRQFWAKMW